MSRTPISERSDAGLLIVEEVFGFVKERHPERSGGRTAQAGIGVRGREAALSPLSTVESGARFMRYGFVRLRIESPFISIRCALCTSRSRMPSASVGSPICSCQRAIGSCEVSTVERRWYLSSQISQKSRRSVR